MSTKDIIIPGVEEIDFGVITTGDREALEDTLFSIAERYKGARITIADIVKEHDRAYFKDLRIQLAEFGLINRVVVHHLAWDTSIGEARNFLMNVMNLKYRTFIEAGYEIGDDTDIEHMAAVMDGNQIIGVVVGAVDDATAPGEGTSHVVGQFEVEKTRSCTPFFLIRRELKNFVRWTGDEKVDAEFASRMSKAPYEMVTMPEIVIHKRDKSDDESRESEGGGNGKTTERTVPSTDRKDEGGSDLLRSGENGTSESAGDSRGQGRSGAGPVQGKGNK